MRLGLGLGLRRPIGTPTPSPSPTLAALTLATPTVAENTAPGATVSAINGKTSGSTLSLVDDAGGRFAISGTYLLTGLTNIDYEAATSYNVTIRETLSGATNTPRDTVLAVAVSDIDEVAPILSSPSDAANGSTGGTLAVTTNEGNGTLYWFVSTSGTPPSAANLKTGTGAVSFGNQAVSGAGVQNVSATGLTASTAYFAHFLHRDAAGNDSAIASGDGFTTAAGGSYQTESDTYFAAMSVQPDATRKGLIDTLIAGLKTDGIWTKLDWLVIPAAHDAQAARLNAINPAKSMTAFNSPTFTTDRGYAGDGSTSYLDSGEALTTGPSWTQNSATIFAWVNVAGAFNFNMIGSGGSTSASLNPFNNTSQTARINGASAVTSVQANRLGLSAGSRTSSNDMASYRNGSQLATGSIASTAPGGNFSLFKVNTAFTSDRVAAFGMGGGLTSTEHGNLYTRLNTFLTAIGAN